MPPFSLPLSLVSSLSYLIPNFPHTCQAKDLSPRSLARSLVRLFAPSIQQLPPRLIPPPGPTRVRLVGSLTALLDDLPEELDVDAARDADALFARRQQARDRAPRLRALVPRILESPVRYDFDLESLPLPRTLGLRGVEVVERDLVARPRQDGRYGERVVQRRALDYAEDIAGSVSYGWLACVACIIRGAQYRKIEEQAGSICIRYVDK